jgi:hypothetical protein
LPLRRVKPVIILKACAKFPFDREGFGDRAREPRRIIAERFFKFGQHLRGASRRIDAFNFQIDLVG